MVAHLGAVGVSDDHCSAALTPTSNASLTELKTGAVILLDGQLLPLAIHFGKPILLTVAYPSGDSGSFQPASATAPDQPDTGAFPLDLGAPAAAYEALLDTIVSARGSPASTTTAPPWPCAPSPPKVCWQRGFRG